MALRQNHTALPWSALAAIIVAAVIGSAPVLTLIALSERLGGVQ